MPPLSSAGKATNKMSHVLQPTETIKDAVKRQLIAAQRAADAYYPGPDAYHKADCDFDFLDVTSGKLLHRTDCPFCCVRKLERAYGRIMQGSPHEKTTH
jgi:hypothetical protein